MKNTLKKEALTLNKKYLTRLTVSTLLVAQMAACDDGDNEEEIDVSTDTDNTEEVEDEESSTETDDSESAEDANVESGDSEETEEEVVEEIEDIEVRFTFTGDIMGHSPQIESAWDEALGAYNYEPVFEYVRPHFEDSDVVFGNLELVLAGPDYAYSGYPQFNSPDSLLDALEYAGYTILNTTNNHSFDMGVDSLIRTRNLIDDSSIQAVGTYTETPESRVHYMDFGDKTFALLTYAETFNGMVDHINNPEYVIQYANFINETYMLEDIEEAKENGADVIIANMHWGDEYQHEPSERAREWTDLLVENGVDIVMGGHPHVIQPAEIVESGDNEAFVVYSLGNFVSNQRFESLGNVYGETVSRATENGVIVHLDITISGDDIRLTDVEFVPTWVYAGYEKTGTYDYVILPTQDFIDDPRFAENYVDRIDSSRDHSLSIIGNYGIFEEEIDLELGNH